MPPGIEAGSSLRRAELAPAALLLIALAGFISAVYAVIVVGVGAAAGLGANNAGLTIAATVIIAITFSPVRTWCQKMINRVVLGKRATPYEILSQFSDRVATTYASADVLTRLARTVADGIGAARTDVWLRVGTELTRRAHYPDVPAAGRTYEIHSDVLPDIENAGHTVEVRHHGELLGAITTTKRDNIPLTAVEQRLLADVASQAGLVLHNVRLTAELERHVQLISAQAEQLRLSRRRIVAAHDAERRRLERDIHDGAQQHLVALAVKARLASTIVEKQPDQFSPMLDELRSATTGALETLRDLSRGIYPTSLRERGVAAALSTYPTTAGLHVHVETPDVLRYEPDVEATLYFVCLEALQNAAKYSGAANAFLRFDPTPRSIRFSVQDDGAGFDPATTRRGSGLQNMADRLATAGGTLAIDSAPGAGTRVTGEIPAVPRKT